MSRKISAAATGRKWRMAIPWCRLPYRLPDLIEASPGSHGLCGRRRSESVDLLAKWNVQQPVVLRRKKWKPEHLIICAGPTSSFSPRTTMIQVAITPMLSARLGYEFASCVRVLELPGLNFCVPRHCRLSTQEAPRKLLEAFVESSTATGAGARPSELKRRQAGRPMRSGHPTGAS